MGNNPNSGSNSLFVVGSRSSSLPTPLSRSAPSENIARAKKLWISKRKPLTSRPISYIMLT